MDKDTLFGVPVYNVDRDEDVQLLVRTSQRHIGDVVQWYPRTTVYASPEAQSLGLSPVEDYPDILIDEKDWKEVCRKCNESQIFAVYHQKNSGVLKDGWNQDGYGYCWAYGLTMAVMDCRTLEGQDPVRLSPFSLGWLVNWRNSGYYCDRAIAGAREKGIAPVEYVPEYQLNPNKFKPGWQQEALKYRPIEWWDTGGTKQQMLKQVVSILATGRPLYVAYNWWGHALEMCGLVWDESKSYNLIFYLRNSHDESDVIAMTGYNAIPDEAYGVRACTIAPK